MLKALVFDMDGTITKPSLPLEAMRQDAKDYFISKGLPSEILEPADGISSSTAKAREYFLSNGFSQDTWDKMDQAVDDILSKHEGYAAATAEQLPGTLKIVKIIRDHGFLTAILTNNGRSSVNQIMTQIPLNEHFQIIQTRHESPRPKPHPDGLLKIIHDLGVEVEEAVYVGDALIDGTAAKRAGIEFWGVASGETSADALIEAGATLVFESLDGILEEALARKSK
ncbi:MAG: HAD family hydrolase [Candidatus Thorarchaeota archaeon]|nr:MAG: HAD family hydrolase [Candidatus Thorarchaeota archaeon]